MLLAELSIVAIAAPCLVGVAVFGDAALALPFVRRHILRDLCSPSGSAAEGGWGHASSKAALRVEMDKCFVNAGHGRVYLLFPQAPIHKRWFSGIENCAAAAVVGVVVDPVASVSHVVAQLLDDMTARVHYLS